MPRIAIATPSPAAAAPLLAAVQAQLGSVPNLFRLLAATPAALEGYLGLNAALGKGRLPFALREGIALTVAEIHGCGYCLAAHGHIGRQFAGLDDAEIAANRAASSRDPSTEAALRFAASLVRARGRVADADLAAVRQAGFDDAAILEIVAHVALNTLTNYVNEVARTDIDFPAA